MGFMARDFYLKNPTPLIENTASRHKRSGADDDVYSMLEERM